MVDYIRDASMVHAGRSIRRLRLLRMGTSFNRSAGTVRLGPVSGKLSGDMWHVWSVAWIVVIVRMRIAKDVHANFGELNRFLK